MQSDAPPPHAVPDTEEEAGEMGLSFLGLECLLMSREPVSGLGAGAEGWAL